MSETESDTYGLMAEFETPEALLEAAKLAYGKGYRTMDAYSPLPIHGLAAAIGFPRTNLPILTFILALTGAIVGYGMQYWIQGCPCPTIPFSTWLVSSAPVRTVFSSASNPPIHSLMRRARDPFSGA